MRKKASLYRDYKSLLSRVRHALPTSPTAVIIITAISTGLVFVFWRANSRFHDTDIKFRTIRQQYPRTALWADTTYYKNPRKGVEITERLEAERNFRKATGIVNSKR